MEFRPEAEFDRRRPGGWAREQAAHRSPTRNRYVDGLRAASIVVVVAGHWLMAAPTVESGVGFTLSDILRVAPWSRWLTWIFQVMPLFFAVGGYANAASLESARDSGAGYDMWVSRRLQRLIRPVVPFILVWVALALAAHGFGVGREIVQTGSRAAFVPVWFLAVYVGVVVLAPVTHQLWTRYGMTSFWALVAAAALVDATARGSGVEEIGALNFIFVWLALHQLGYAWRSGAFGEPHRALACALAGFTSLVVLEGLAGYPVSMVTVPGATPANAAPPTLALLSLGVAHIGLLTASERTLGRFLERDGIWVTTVLLNGAIMTIYLWHATAMVLLVGLSEILGGIGLRSVPHTATWWLFRLPWLVVLLGVLSGMVALFGRFEAHRVPAGHHPAAWRSVAGAMIVCAGLVALAAGGIGGEGATAIRVWPVALSLIGASLVTLRSVK